MLFYVSCFLKLLSSVWKVPCLRILSWQLYAGHSLGWGLFWVQLWPWATALHLPNHAWAKASESLCMSQSFTRTLCPAVCQEDVQIISFQQKTNKWETTGLWITSLNFPCQISSFPTARRITALNTGGTGNTRAVGQSEKLREKERDRERGNSREQGRHQGSRHKRWSVRKRKGRSFGKRKKEGRKRLTPWNMSNLPFDSSLNILKLYLLCNLWSCLR